MQNEEINEGYLRLQALQIAYERSQSNDTIEQVIATAEKILVFVKAASVKEETK